LREELLAVLGARRELDREDEQYLVEVFLDRLDREIDARIEARLAERAPRRRMHPAALFGLAIPLLALAIPLSAIAGDVAGQAGLLVVWAGIVAILALAAWSSSR
jgi:hypothetical protein